MGSIRFALKMLKSEKKQCKFYIISMIFAIAIIFNVFNILFNEDFVRIGSENYIAFSALAVIVMAVAMLFVAFSNLYFIYGKTKELAIAVLSGRSVYEVGFILVIQNTILGLIGSIIGLFVGVVLMPLVNAFVYANAGKIIKDYTISPMGTVLMLVILALLFIMMVLIDMGYVYRREVVELLAEKSKMIEKEKVGVGFHLLGSENLGFSFKLPHFIYPILFISPVIIYAIPFEVVIKKVSIMSYGIMASIFGTVGMVNYIIPKLIGIIKKKYFSVDKRRMQSLSTLVYLLRKTNYLILILIVTTIYITTIICSSSYYPQIRAIALVIYFVVACIISVTIIYKAFIEAENLKDTFKQLSLLGYVKKDIQAIIRQIITYLYLIIFLLTVIPLGSFIVTYIQGGFISWEICRILIEIYVGIIVVSFIVSYIGFNRIILSSLNRRS